MTGIGHFSRSAQVCALMLVVCAAMAGCRGTGATTTWSSAAVKSPDGRWSATARSQEWGGFGTAYAVTTVALKSTESGATADVLAFSQQYATMCIEVKWLSPNRLAVSFGPSSRPGDQVDLNYQVTVFYGISISAQRVHAGCS